MSKVNNIIKLNYGSDFLASFPWLDGNGNAVDLTGYSISVYDADDYTQANMTATISDASNGVITLSMEWNDNMPQNKEARFRVRITLNDYDVSTNKLYFEVQ